MIGSSFDVGDNLTFISAFVKRDGEVRMFIAFLVQYFDPNMFDELDNQARMRSVVDLCGTILPNDKCVGCGVQFANIDREIFFFYLTE
ncbi:hypothetical protein D3C80_1472300 [compost metagenome]